MKILGFLLFRKHNSKKYIWLKPNKLNNSCFAQSKLLALNLLSKDDILVYYDMLSVLTLEFNF